MGKRLLALNFTIDRPPKDINRYTMIKHTKRQRTSPKLVYHRPPSSCLPSRPVDRPSRCRYKLLEGAEERFHKDGLEQRLWKTIKVPRYAHPKASASLHWGRACAGDEEAAVLPPLCGRGDAAGRVAAKVLTLTHTPGNSHSHSNSLGASNTALLLRQCNPTFVTVKQFEPFWPRLGLFERGI